MNYLTGLRGKIDVLYAKYTVGAKSDAEDDIRPPTDHAWLIKWMYLEFYTGEVSSYAEISIVTPDFTKRLYRWDGQTEYVLKEKWDLIITDECYLHLRLHNATDYTKTGYLVFGYIDVM